MKPTLAIYGDSYADDKCYYLDDNGDFKSKWEFWSHIGPSYVELLENHFEVHRFARCGSSLEYSLNIFEKNHKDFDHVIFCATESGRFEIRRDQFNFGPALDDTYHVYGPSFIGIHERKLKWVSFKERRFLKSLKDFYFPYIWKNDQECFEHSIAVKKINWLRPDALVIDCYSGNDNSLMSVQKNELINFDFKDGNFPPGLNDLRKCHFTEENHIILYNALKDYFLENKDFKISNLKWIFDKKDKNQYFRELT